jgi:hypothetical protein
MRINEIFTSKLCTVYLRNFVTYENNSAKPF